jgi:hypothetical protein
MSKSLSAALLFGMIATASANAKKRGVPTSVMRGPKRASQPFQDVTAAR